MRSQARRARELRRCLANSAKLPRRRRLHARQACLRRYGRTPGRVVELAAFRAGRTRIRLTFEAPGADGYRPPPARGYLVKQSRNPIRGSLDFRRAQPLCAGDCAFRVSAVGEGVALTITNLRPHTTYYYAVEARDNVSHRPGPRSVSVTART